jgi:hypothetical protein
VKLESAAMRRATAWLVAVALAAAAGGALAATLVQQEVTPLSWAPPALTDPITVPVPDTGPIQAGNPWPHVLSLDPARDYVIELGHRRDVGGLVIEGGRNVVLIGGRITIPRQSTAPSDAETWRRRGLLIAGATGVVHIEGVRIDGELSHMGKGSELTEGINVQAPEAKALVLQNIRIVGVRSFDRQSFSDNHPDVLQCWACPPSVWIDGLTATTDYQGIQLCNDGPATAYPRDVRLKRVNLRPSHPTFHIGLWICDRGTRTSLSRVYIRNSHPSRLDQAVGCRVQQTPWRCLPDGRRYAGGVAGRLGRVARYQSRAGDYVWWPKRDVENIAGRVVYGDPPDGDFVPPRIPGLAYEPPGYLRTPF